MTVVHRHSEPSAPSREGASARRAGVEEAGLDPGEGAGVEGLCRDPGDRAGERPAYRLRRGGLPQYRRVLGEEARDLHDHGGHLHARLRLLQRQDRTAGPARSGRSPPCRAGDRETRAPPRGGDLGRSRRSRRRRRRPFRRRDPRDPRALPGHDHRGAHARFPAQGAARSKRWWPPSPTCSTTIWRRFPRST